MDVPEKKLSRDEKSKLRRTKEDPPWSNSSWLVFAEAFSMETFPHDNHPMSFIDRQWGAGEHVKLSTRNANLECHKHYATYEKDSKTARKLFAESQFVYQINGF